MSDVMRLLHHCKWCGMPKIMKPRRNQVCECRYCVGLRKNIKKIETELDELYHGGLVVNLEISEQRVEYLERLKAIFEKILTMPEQEITL